MLHNIQVPIVSQIKILGLNFSNYKSNNKLNFNSHIIHITKKIINIKNILFNFCKNTYGLNSKKRITLYECLLRPIKTYGSEIWIDHITKSHIKKLESIQYSIIRNAIIAYKTTSLACTTIQHRLIIYTYQN